MKRTSIILGGLGLLAILGAGCIKAPEISVPAEKQPAVAEKTAPAVEPSVSVTDQTVVDNSVTIGKIVAVSAANWIVIHANNNNAPGPVIGYSGIGAGESKDIKVALDMTKVTPKLYAMLHEDTGVIGSYEFPNDDLPAKDGETVVTVPFNVTLPSAGVGVDVKAGAAIDATKSGGEKSGAAMENKTEVKLAPAPEKTPSTPPANPQPTPAPVSPPANANPAPVSAVKSFTVTARTWSFEPATITVKKGDTVKLEIKSMDVPHGFALSSFGINKTLDPNQTVNVEFVADKTGTFPFFCSVSCGSGHSGMKGTLVVE